jgi:hypothetical protein
MTDEHNIREKLWEELKLLQSIIDKHDEISFRIKNWFITLFLAVTGYALYNPEYFDVLLKLNYGLILIFYFYEVAYRTSQGAFLLRSREVQRVLRGESKPDDFACPPHLDRHLTGANENGFKTTLKVDYVMLKEFFRRLFQLRISFIYWGAVIINLFLSRIKIAQ